MGRFFTRNPEMRLKKKILKHGFNFLTKPKFWGFRMAKTPENRKSFEKRAYFSRKILNNGYPFLPKWPLKMGRGFEARAAHPCPNQIYIIYIRPIFEKLRFMWICGIWGNFVKIWYFVNWLKLEFNKFFAHVWHI